MTQSANVYPNGLPHPPMEVRRRMALELAILAVLTGVYLYVMPDQRPLGIDIGMAIVGLGLVGFSARHTRERIWGPPSDADFDRRRRCALVMTAVTLPAIFLFMCFGIVSAYLEHSTLGAVAVRLFKPTFFLALLMYVPWALVQQTLFQFYLLGRLRALLPFASPLFLSFLNGIAYGAVHLPDWDVTLVTMVGGVVWSYSYHRDRYVLPIALSHALLGATYFYWVCDRDLMRNTIWPG